MFSHYLLTRFNVIHKGLSQYALEQRGTVVQTDEWQKRRFDLFDRYCFPSVNRQSTKNFKWLVFFNAETPESYLKKIEEYSLLCPMFHPIFVNAETDEVQEAINFIKRDCCCDYVITTRIDNDDMIHRDYMQLIQRSFFVPTQSQNVFLCYRWGYQYDTLKKVILKFADDYNHFESRIEQIDQLQTVWVKNDRHDLVSQYGDIVSISPKEADNNAYPGMWIEVVHECNVTNNTGWGKPMKLHSEAFSPYLKTNPFNHVIYQLHHSLKRRFIGS